jgi:ribonuclease HI
MSIQYKLYCDGSSRGNPGPSGVGAILYCGNQTISCLSRYIGETTNTVAEYVGVIYGLDMCINHNVKNLLVCLDSKCIVNQILQEWNIFKPHLIHLANKVHQQIPCFDYIDFKFLPREFNGEADKLAKHASLLGMNQRQIDHEYLHTLL